MAKRLTCDWECLSEAVQTISQAVRPCRLSLFVVVLGVWVILGVVQSGEGLAAVCDRFFGFDFIVFSIAMLWWGGNSWYLARAMLRFEFPDTKAVPPQSKDLHDWVVRWLPRMLGVGPLGCVAVGLWRCPAQRGTRFWPSFWMATFAVTFGAFLCVRKSLLMRMKVLAENRKPGALLRSFWQDLDGLYDATLVELSELPAITKWNLGANVTISVFFFFMCAFIPVSFAQALGAPTVLISSLSAWIACGSIVTYLSSWTRAPLSLFLVAAAFIFSGYMDNHVATPRSAVAAPVRSPIAVDFANWRRESGVDDGLPFIVVASEGGGIRAAYWTAAILAGLQDGDANFASRVYAISSVSGGSLGAATFDALLTSKRSGGYRAQAAAILGNDFLAPPLARLLYTDLVQRFIPYGVSFLDRGGALEQAWIAAFAAQKLDCFDEAFDAFWVKHPALPRLFLNSTWVEQGSRVVLSYAVPTPSDDVIDGDTLASFTLAGAVHASARFPYISPPLTVPGKERTWGHLVDGGYFENSGAVTAKEIIDAAVAGVPRPEPSVTDRAGAISRSGPARVIVIRYCVDTAGERAARWATELTAPPLTFFAARDARGTLAVKSLKRMFNDVDLAEFCLQARPGRPELPLGWMLSTTAQREIDEQAAAALSEGGLAAKVYAWLR